MTIVQAPADRIGPDRGPIASGIAAIGLAIPAAIGASAITAIVLVVTFELVPVVMGQYEWLLFIAAASRFSAEVGFLLAVWIVYRRCRGLPVRPRRFSVRWLMGMIGVLGLIAARFVGQFGPWLDR